MWRIRGGQGRDPRLHRLLQQRKAANRAWQNGSEGEDGLPAFQAALPPGGRRGRAD